MQHHESLPHAAAGNRKSLLGAYNAFLKLGLTSFGGPIAHLGYVREEFVVRRKWMDDRVCAGLVALCQFTPGPASSKVGIGIGCVFLGASRDDTHVEMGISPGKGAAVLALALFFALLAALYSPVWTSAIKAPADFGLGLAAFALLVLWKLPPRLVVLSARGGWVLGKTAL